MGTVVTVELSREAGEKLMAKFNAGECPELEAMGVTKIEPKQPIVPSYTGSAERLAELIESRDKARRKHFEAEDKLHDFLRGVKLSKETHPAIMHHVLNTEDRKLTDEEYKIAYGVDRA